MSTPPNTVIWYPEMTDNEFQKAVNEAMDELPPAVRAQTKDVQIIIKDAPGAEAEGERAKRQLLGLYVGEPLPEQGATNPATFPAQIFIYRKALVEKCGEDYELLLQELQLTLLHEVGHHLGMSDDEMSFLESDEAEEE